jgi:hypothetical protein
MHSAQSRGRSQQAYSESFSLEPFGIQQKGFRPLYLPISSIEIRGLTVVCLITLDETPSIDINDLTGTITSKEIETANSLAECFDYVSAVCYFVVREFGDESRFLSIGISTD